MTSTTPAQAPPSGPAEGIRFVVLDCETTGFSPESGDRMVSLALVTVEDGLITDRWTSLVDPGRDTGPVHIHGITNDEAAAAPPFSALVPEILSRLEGAVLVAHNVGFDLRFLAMELERAGTGRLPETAVDTLRLARRYLPELDNHRLTTCVAALGIPHRAHRADSDAEVTAVLLAELLRRAAEEGQAELSLLSAPAADVLREERRKRARCHAGLPGISQEHRAAHRLIAAWEGGTAGWQRALETLRAEDCADAGRLWGWFGGMLCGETSVFGPPQPAAARQALLTGLRLRLADAAAGAAGREDIGQIVTHLATLDRGSRSPAHLLELFPGQAAAVAALPGCGACWSCDAVALCDTGSAGAALVSHYGPATGEPDELAARLPPLADAGDLAALGRGARYAGQQWERRGRAEDAVRLWHWAVDRGARDLVLLGRLSLYYERRAGDDAAALAVCERALAARREGAAAGRPAWEALARRAERCRRRLAGALS
ncbi:exonuclease domain-containing protein [Streptomyces sp. DSM 44917]|uniref:Exonuclease domain-containing protein n=1 Tax=Streptomyces boetiae TaxID=3075541 RepID=A0ABU2L5B8_9ACTN|nr:exonuclease domain-containing protein [Streptomyces sp. DSM 44917]MDT0306702.1 exonuclease domain-containing protein [Streptomyces sp. DSM 44917]